MIVTYGDFIGTLEVEIQKLQDVELYLNDQGKLLLKAYRKIRDLTAFAESCQELIEIGVMRELNLGEEKAARLALMAIDRIAKAEDAQENSGGHTQEVDQLFDAMCNQRCRFRELGQEKLDEKCEECPLNKLAELIGV